MKHALVIGGGIGGPVAAMALQRAGIEATVFEAHAGPAEHLGLFLTLGVNGMRILRDLELLDRIVDDGCIATPAIEFRSTTGRRIGVVGNGWLDEDTPSVTVMRGSLQAALADLAAERGIGIKYGKRLVEYQVTETGVSVRFDDGSTAAGDLLIGADGIHSRVRSLMAPESPKPAFTGLLNLGGIVPDSGLTPSSGTMHMVWGRHGFFGYTVRGDGEAWWFANIGSDSEPTADIASVSTEVWRRRLRDLFRGDPAPISELIARTPEIGATPINDLVHLPTWAGERVVLLGDAAHAVSPSSGQGASLAIEDAVMLAKCLRDLGSLETALERYEALRRPRAERIVAEGRKRGAYKAPRTRAALWLRDLLLPVAFRVFANEERLSWIHDYRIPWDDPVAAPA